MKKFGFWTTHNLSSEGGGFDSPPTEGQLSGLCSGVPLIHGSEKPQVWMLREVFDSFEEGKAWMDGVFHETEWEDYLSKWKKT